MLRIKQRYALVGCAACTCIFLTLYLIINYAAPNEEKKPNFSALETKLQQLENGLVQHGQEMKTLKQRLKGELWRQRAREHYYEDNDVAQNLNVQIKTKQCDSDTDEAPQTDIQMLELYDKMSFEDIDGGVWKQGWNIKYEASQYSEENKLKVFVVPHSHNDPGWIKTFDNYYDHDTKHILSNALRHLKENPEMKFIWAEISYFVRFFDDLGHLHKQQIKKLVQNKQLEFVSGGWVMPDEANSHWLSVLLQLTEGQTWLKQNFNVTPISAWAIDPFGHSATLPYLLKGSGFQNMLIQRTHYSVKKELARNKQLEFFWQQLWDKTGRTGILTHMMPFYSYDIPHTCGPDPKICCQFDFKRLGSYGVYCPWRVPPRAIDETNVAQRAELLVDQWMKKAELYKTNALLVPLGDDFRFSQSTEWDVQRINYNMLFDYINSHPEMHVEAKFGTLQEYFDALRKERAGAMDFPTLSGDFFTYADRADNYWSGYYTSRPYHKRLDRVLLHYVRSAEMLHALSAWSPVDHKSFETLLQQARRQLSLFQHHDGIPGTARTHVMLDYAQRMSEALRACSFVMQQAAYKLLTKPGIYNPDFKFTYLFMDESRWPATDNERTTIILGDELPSKHVVFYNSLAHWREEVVDFYVSSPHMAVRDLHGHVIPAQISPVWSWYRHTQSSFPSPQASTTKYRLIFKVRVPPLGLVAYVIHAETSKTRKPNTTTFSSNLILSETPMSIHLGEYPQEIKFAKHREISLHVGKGPTVIFSADGMMKSMKIAEHEPHIPVQIKFYKYTTRLQGERSGAYLFLPAGPATPLHETQSPVVIVSEGILESSVIVGLPYAVHQTILRGEAPEIRNLVNLTDMDDTEIIMRFQTHIKSEDIFYTDLNGLQLIKRRRLKKLPLQANYYPIPTAIYIEDYSMRLTVLSAQPLGGSSLAAGEFEIMQDRRLTHDDERGLGQGVLDNQPVLNIFRVVLEHTANCKELGKEHPAGALTLISYYHSKALLYPLHKMIFVENDWLGVQGEFGAMHQPVDEDIDVMAMRQLSRQAKQQTLGLIVHRTLLLKCADDGYRSGMLNLHNLMQWQKNQTTMYTSTLTFLKRLHTLENKELPLCPMDLHALIIQLKLTHS